MFVLKSYKESLVIARDTIYDFSRAEKDKVDLSGNQAFTFIGTKEFSELAEELRYFKKGGDTFLYGDLNGDAGIDFRSGLTGRSSSEAPISSCTAVVPTQGTLPFFGRPRFARAFAVCEMLRARREVRRSILFRVRSPGCS